MAGLKKTNIRVKLIIGLPTFFVLAFIVLIAINYISQIKNDINLETKSIERSLSRAVKIVSSLDYGISTLFSSDTQAAVPHYAEVRDGLCRVEPVLSEISKSSNILHSSAVSIDYIVLGPESMCEEGSPLMADGSKRLALAPALSFLHDLDDDIQAVHFVATESYVMSSPAKFIENVDSQRILRITDKPFWRKTANNKKQITVTGPVERRKDYGQLLSLSSPVIDHHSYKGMVMVDILVSGLLHKDEPDSRNLQLINVKAKPLPGNALFVQPLIMDGVGFSHVIYYPLDLKEEIVRFLKTKSFIFQLIGTIYVIVIMVLLYLNSRIESRYFKDLARQDPMTGLLNRRGLELVYRKPCKYRYIALGVYDIDDFKKINDTHGHDVGDEVICFVANTIRACLRDTDTVARIGGEEFVIYLRGDSVYSMLDALERVKEAIVEKSHQVLKDGFTVSGGISISEVDEDIDFDTQFKQADERLYIAKTTGKNRVVS